jgi:hypothetical protein
MTLFKAFLAVCICALALPARAEDMKKYLTDTKEMVRQGKYPEALNRYVWFYDHAVEHDPNVAAVRATSALSDWKLLANVYPPAKAAMIETRDRQTKQLVYGDKIEAAVFGDVVALNRVLEDDKVTVDLFQWVDQTEPAAAKRCWVYAKPVILAAKRYELAGKYIGNPVRQFDVVKEMYDMATNQGIGGATIKALNEDRFVEQCLQLIELSLALDEPKAAKEIQEKALASVDDRRLRKAIPAPEAVPK